MATVDEAHAVPTLITSRVPVGPNSAKSGTQSIGGMALNDSLMIIIGCWVLVGIMYFSLHSFNV